MRAYTAYASTAITKTRKIEETRQALVGEPESGGDEASDPASYGFIHRLCFLFLYPRFQVRSIPSRICKIDFLGLCLTLCISYSIHIWTLTDNSTSVHFVPGKRILLRDRRRLPYRPIQPHWTEHRGAILPICPGFSYGCLWFRLRWWDAGDDWEVCKTSLRTCTRKIHCHDTGLSKDGSCLSLQEYIGRLTWISAREIQKGWFREMPTSHVQVTSITAHGAIRQSER